MKWTKQEPKDNGWYWLRQVDTFSETGILVRIEYIRWYGKKLCLMNWPIPKNTEWAGPIPEPKEAQNEIS